MHEIPKPPPKPGEHNVNYPTSVAQSMDRLATAFERIAAVMEQRDRERRVPGYEVKDESNAG